MRLHIQESVHVWSATEIEPCRLTGRKPLIEQIERILGQEKDIPSEKRKSSGFFVTLNTEEEAKLRKHLEPIFGKLNNDQFRQHLSMIVETTSNKIKVYHYIGGEGVKERPKPTFSFGTR